MSKQRFSSEMLYRLRNGIPIDVLIEKTLKIPSRTIEGYFRFLCPICNEYNSAIKRETNFARCFRCEKNFNTIDLVMLIRKSGFIQSVYYLKDIYDGLSADPGYPDPQDNKTETGKKKNMPIQLGKILGNIVPFESETNNSQKQATVINQGTVNARVIKLEETIKELINRIDQIEAIVNPKFTTD